MVQRATLQVTLEGITGNKNVHFQPPPGLKLNYPCIVYSRDRSAPTHADNSLYANSIGYAVTVIDPNPDSSLLDKVAALPLCAWSRHYTADGLNHDVYILYH